MEVGTEKLTLSNEMLHWQIVHVNSGLEHVQCMEEGQGRRERALVERTPTGELWPK